MEARFNEISYHKHPPRDHGPKTVHLPFERVSARALIIRRADGAILGVRHRPGMGMALPGGGLDDGETPLQAAIRELEEEQITLVNPGAGWEERFGVDYYGGYRELNFWYVIAVDEALVQPGPEILEWSWVPQAEDPWYPHLRQFLLLLVEKFHPELLAGGWAPS